LRDIEIYPYGFRYETEAQGWLRRHGSKLVLSIGIAATMLSTTCIIIYSGDFKLAWVYSLACATCLSFFFMCRKDILAPVGIATGWYVFGFLLAVPFYISLERLYPKPSSSVFVQTVGLSLIGLWAFAIGTVSGFQRIVSPIFRWITRTRTSFRSSSHSQFVFVLIWVLLGAAIRLYFNIGKATEESVIKIANLTGIIQFMFKDGSLILMGLLLYRSFEQRGIFMIESYLLLVGYVVTQLLLGWKGAILKVFILLVILLWYQQYWQRRRTFTWALIMILFIPLTVQIGYSVRTRYYTGRSVKYSESPIDFTLKAVTRLDGNTRFAKVLEHETIGQGISFTNGFKLITLLRNGMTAMQYSDIYVHRIALERKTSTGASGPGGAYIGLGILGIIIGYFLLGGVYQSVYKLIDSLSCPVLAIVLYGLMTSMLMGFFSENFGVSEFLKRLFISAIILVLSRLFLRTNTECEVLYR
jgi:hypothetical protein